MEPADRLGALGLRTPPPRWVPEPPGEALAAAPITAPPAAPPSMDGLARAWVQDRVPPWAHGVLEHLRLRVLVAVVVAALVVGVVVVLHHHSRADNFTSYDGSGTGSTSEPSTLPSVAPAAAASTAATSIVVDVGGKVRKPGLVTLPPGSRVADALAAAGGPLRPREITDLNLAARVSDGQLLLIGVSSSTVASTGSGDGTGGADVSGSPSPVSLSSATIEDLETLPGVGPATAQKIIDFRTANNGFTSVTQLQQVPGIGPVKYGELSPLVTP